MNRENRGRALALLALGLAWLAVVDRARAAKVKAWHHATPGAYEKASLRRAVVSNTGVLRLSRRLHPLAALEANHVWAVAEDGDGNLCAGTGDEGKVYKVTPDGKARVAYSAEASQVLALAIAADGTVYAGTAPSGQVVCIPP